MKRVLSGLLAVFLAMILCMTGVAAVDAAGNVLGAMNMAPLREIIEQPLAETWRIATDPVSYQIIGSYTAAVADSIINLEIVPQDYVSKCISVLRAEPGNVTITSMRFEGKNLLIYCTAPAEEDTLAFAGRLNDRKDFTGSYVEAYQNSQGKIVAVITCIEAPRE